MFDPGRCSLAHCIATTNNLLKPSKLTCSKHGNPHTKTVIRATKKNNLQIFSQYLGIEFLNKEQSDIFCKKEDRMFLTGPAGSGKTILLQGRIIELVKMDHTTKHVFIFVFGSEIVEQYLQVLSERAGIAVSVLEYTDDIEATELVQQATRGGVTLMDLLVRMSRDDYVQRSIAVLSAVHNAGSHCFVDDLQSWLWVMPAYFSTDDYLSTAINTLSDLLCSNNPASTGSIVWFVCDIIQCVFFWIADDCKDIAKLADLLSQLPITVTTLSSNLRNTMDMAQMLSHIRSTASSTCTSRNNYINYTTTRYINYTTTRRASKMCNTTSSSIAHLDSILPRQLPGHCIRGTVPALYVIHEDQESKATTQEIVSNTVVELLHTEPIKLQYNDVAVIYTIARWDTMHGIVEAALEEQNIPYSTETSRASSSTGNTANLVWTGYVNNTSSLEWAAAIVMFDVTSCPYEEDEFSWYFPMLYLALSRARVHCTVIVTYREEDRDVVKYLLDMLRPHVLVKRDDTVNTGDSEDDKSSGIS